MTEKYTVRNFVGGESVDAADGRASRPGRPDAPARSSARPRCPAAQDVDRGHRPRRAAFETWRDTTPSRAAAGAAAARRRDRGARRRARRSWRAENTGKPIGAHRERGGPADGRPDPLLRRRRPHARGQVGAASTWPGTRRSIRREPIGVVAQVTPWNYPMMMAVWKFAPAIAAGNTVVLKPSDTTPVTTRAAGRAGGGVPAAGVLNVVCGDRDTGRALVEHPIPQMVSITGSVRAGHAGGRRPRRATSSGCTSSWAARRRSWSSTTPTSRPRPRASRSPATSTPGRTAPPRPACWPRPGSTTTSSPR